MKQPWALKLRYRYNSHTFVVITLSRSITGKIKLHSFSLIPRSATNASKKVGGDGEKSILRSLHQWALVGADPIPTVIGFL